MKRILGLFKMLLVMATILFFVLFTMDYLGDATLSVEELQAAAEKGDVDAQLSLGTLYSQGKNVPPDPAAARKWFRAAADQGHMQGQYLLGLSYLGAADTDPDALGQAAHWLELAAKKEHPRAAYHLGEILRTGALGPPNPERAEKLLQTAYRAGVTEACAPLGRMALDRIDPAAPPAEIFPHLAAARDYFTCAAKAGDTSARRWLLKLKTLLEEKKRRKQAAAPAGAPQ